MFTSITAQLDELFEQKDDNDVFRDVVVYMYSLPLWKLLTFYLYTFTIRDKELAQSYRRSVKWVKFPYTLRYKIFKIRMRALFRR